MEFKSKTVSRMSEAYLLGRLKDIMGACPVLHIDESEESSKALALVRDFEKRYRLKNFIRISKDSNDINDFIYADSFYVAVPVLFTKEGIFEGLNRIRFYLEEHIPYLLSLTGLQVPDPRESSS